MGRLSHPLYPGDLSFVDAELHSAFIFVEFSKAISHYRPYMVMCFSVLCTRAFGNSVHFEVGSYGNDSIVGLFEGFVLERGEWWLAM